METTAEATSTNTTKPVIWWQGPLINAWSPGKVIAWERGFVSPQEKVQNLCGVQSKLCYKEMNVSGGYRIHSSVCNEKMVVPESP